MFPNSRGCCLNGFADLKWEKYRKAQRLLAMFSVLTDLRVLHYISFKTKNTVNTCVSLDATMGYYNKSAHEREIGETFCGMT